LHQEQCEITCDADAKSSRNARGARRLSRMPQRQKRHIPGVASGWRDASENPSGGAGPRGAEGLENAARNFLDNRRGGFRKARNPKWARNDLERGESKARKVSDAAREGGAEKRGALVRQGGDVCKSAEVRGDSERVPTGLAGASRCKATGLEWLPSERPILGLRGESNPSGKNTLRETERRRCAAILDT